MRLLYISLIFWNFHVFGSQNVKLPDTNEACTDSLFSVGTVTIVGNEKTKDFVILREMSLQPGKSVTRELVDYDQNRIYGLGLFNRVIIHVVPATEETADLIVEVSERWYIFPFPVFGIRDHDWKKVYFGGGLLHSNFRGRNEKLYGIVVLGYDPSVAVSYRNPFLVSDGSYQLDTRFAFDKIRNRSLSAQAGGDNFDEKHLSLMLSLGRRFGIDHSVWLTLGGEMVTVSSYEPGRTISPNGKDFYPFGGLSYTYDTRDLYEYPMMGSFARLSVRKYGLPGNQIDFVRYATDFRHYQPLLSPLVLTGRLFTDWAAAGRTPSYNRTYLGYTERIRGHFKEVREGENLFGFSAELHCPLYGPVYYSVDYLPAEFRVLKFGIIAALFADAGTVWFRGEPFALNTFTKGYGAGIHLLLPYSIVLRFDYAWNEYRRGELIIDLGTAF